MSLGEFDLIRRFFDRPGSGIGDDCALLTPAPGHQWLVSTDMLVEGRHFFANVDPEALGHKALAVNLSDLAACGATPRACFLALALPRVDETWLDGFARGFFALADAHRIPLAGGDTTAGPLTLCVTVMGEAPAGQALLRSGARDGDAVWVSGPLGDARLALEMLRGGVPGDLGAVRSRLERPTPRVALGQQLRGRASSCIDLSDGLLGDLGHVLRASGVGATLDLAALPRSAALAAQPETLQQTCLLAGGDDYELLFTAPAGEDFAALGCTRIGRIEAAPGLRVPGVDRLPASFDHFRP
jgi:thiamine-monophosphate kinase